MTTGAHSQKRHRLLASWTFYHLVATCQTQLETNLSISSSCNKLMYKIRLVASLHLDSCWNLLKQLAASLWMTSFDNELGTSLLTTCNRPVVNKLYWQVMRTHPDIGLWIKSVATCQKTLRNLRVFWLYKRLLFLCALKF